ncbi:hypothetical protein [Cryobacterium sp. N21]|uniref:hypothetical protein n=1 Tax=Cryobacterium sp. N21 TaxID=2048289 RepID=UPI000CE4E1BC|nr:hypothetical protein [Cryobacterium sp. N21]
MEIGWDATSMVLFLPAGHRLIARPVCRATGCAVTAPDRMHIRVSCRRRLDDAGISAENIALLPVRERPKCPQQLNLLVVENFLEESYSL